MKVTNKNARIDKAGKHNDRNFNLDNAPHIDQDRISENLYYTYNGDEVHSFTEVEREFYETHFSEYLKAQNLRNEQTRHRERNRTLDDYLHGAHTRPEDKILQIGNIKEHATKEQLWDCAMEYMRRFDEHFGDQCKILDMALHMDEATPHVHVRRVWIAQNEDGHEYVNQKKALEQMGIMNPDSEKPEGKYNNPKITFTQTDIQLFRDICIEKGLDIDMTPPERRESLKTLDYKKQQIAKDIKNLERERESLSTNLKETKEVMDDLDDVLEEMISYFDQNPYFADNYESEINEAKARDRAERFRILARIYDEEAKKVIDSTDDFDKATIKAEANKELSGLRAFIKEKGLEREYEEFSNRSSQEREEQTRPGSFF